MLKEVNTKVIILLLLILKIKRHKKGNEKENFFVSLSSLFESISFSKSLSNDDKDDDKDEER